MANSMADEEVNCKLDKQMNEIDSCIEQLLKLKAELEESKREQDLWKSKRFALYANVLAKKVKYSQNKKWEMLLRKKTTEIIDRNGAAQMEWKDLRAQRSAERTEKCRNFSIKGIDYAGNFPRAQNEYSDENLTTSINDYRVISRKVEDELRQLRAELDRASEEYKNKFLKTNSDAEEFKIDTLVQYLKSANSHLHAVLLADHRIQDLQNRIKQAKEAINRYKQGPAKSVFRKPNAPL